MKIKAGILFLSLGLLHLAHANEETASKSLQPLEQLREQYQADRAALDQINQTGDKILEQNKNLKNPRSGPEWSKYTKAWLPLFQKAEASYPKYLNALVAAYCDLPFAGARAKELSNEIEKQHPDYSKHTFTVNYYQRHNLLANAIIPHLYNKDIERERAEFFSKLLKPNASTKIEDVFHFFRLPAEPQDWSVQTAYSLACLRAGKMFTARKENKKLIRKAARLSEEKLKRFLIQRALIEAHDGKKDKANKFLSKAQDIKNGGKNEETLLDETRSILAGL